MKTVGLLLLFLLIGGTTYGQCDCSNEKEWSTDIALREATLKNVITTGNRDAILAVDNLIIWIGSQSIFKTIGNSDPSCKKMDDALVEESKVETKMITDYTAALKKKQATHP